MNKPCVVFVGSGGTGSLLSELCSRVPCLLLTYGENNSLPSALEGKFRRNARARIVFLDDVEKIPKEFFVWKRIISGLEKRKAVGLIGGSKRPLSTEEKELFKKLNCKVVKIPLEEFLREMNGEKSWKKTKEALERLKRKRKLDDALASYRSHPAGFWYYPRVAQSCRTS